jgi:dolichol-phosphate mannosyltransferase
MAARDATPKVSLILPMFNEGPNVDETLQRVLALEEKLGGPLEVIPVNDGSTDDTLERLKAFAKKEKRVRPTGYPKNRGRGKALRTGFAVARGEYIVSLDADLSYDPAQIPELVALLEKEPDLDAVLPSAYMPGGGTEGVAPMRLAISKAGNKFLSFFWPQTVYTSTCIFRAYRGSSLRRLDLESDGKEIHLEILSKAFALGYRMREVPSVLRSRKKGTSKFRFRRTAFTHLLFSLLEKPGFLFGFGGALLLVLGIAACAYLVYLWQTVGVNPERPLFTIMTVLVLGGMQLFSFGVLSLLIVNLRREIYRTQRENLELKELLLELVEKRGE